MRHKSFVQSTKKRQAPISPLFTGVLEDGMVFVFAGASNEEGEEYVTPATTATGQRIAGILSYSASGQESVPTQETLTPRTASARTLTLRKTPIALTSIRVVRTDTDAAVVLSAGSTPGGADEGALLADVLVFGSALADIPLVISYRYAIAAEDLAKFGRRSVNNGGEQQIGRVTLNAGDVDMLISNFDIDVAYTLGAALFTRATGIVSSASGGTSFATVASLPSLRDAEKPEQLFLGIRASIA